MCSSLVNSIDGATIYPITDVPVGLLTRAFLVDIPKLLDVKWLEPQSQWITKSMLEKFVAMNNIQILPGDVMLLRTGFYAFSKETEGGHANPEKTGSPGLHPLAMEWIHENDISGKMEWKC